MKHKIIFGRITLFILLAALSPHIYAAVENDSLAIRTQFTKNLHASGARALEAEKRITDSLSRSIEILNLQRQSSMKSVKDSTLKSAGKSLDQKRILSITNLYSHYSGELKTYSRKQQILLEKNLQKYPEAIDDLIDAYLPCRNCRQYSDYENELNVFQEKVDRSTDAFFDTASVESEKAFDLVNDTADVMLDSLVSYIETLIDDRQDELDESEEISDRITASAEFKSHNSYLGRDGGISQASLIPSITLALKSGIRFSASAAWVEEPEFHQDGIYLGIGYDFNLLPFMCVSFSYTYISYEDSSIQNQSVFNHGIDGGVYLETAFANLNGSIGVYIGDQVEYTIIAGISRSIPLGIISLDPSLTISWGEQNGELIAERWEKTQSEKGNSQGKGKGNGNSGEQLILTTAVIPQNIFSIMAYEINIPLNIRLGSFTITPSVSCIIPKNVSDGSREIPYLNAGLKATYNIGL